MRRLRVGVLSDTHGLLRPEARQFLVGCDYIIHGGDIGGVEILESLEALAPVIAVRGNNDKGAWAAKLKHTELVRIGDLFLYAIHDLNEMDLDPEAADVKVVISGHSHKPKIEQRGEVLYLNPGSCGPRRFKLPISIGELTILGRDVAARTVDIEAK